MACGVWQPFAFNGICRILVASYSFLFLAAIVFWWPLFFCVFCALGVFWLSFLFCFLGGFKPLMASGLWQHLAFKIACGVWVALQSSED